MGGMVFTSCEKDEDPEPQELKPTITFNTGSGLTSSDVTISAGESITIGVVASENVNSGANLQRVRIYVIENNVALPDIVDTTFNETSFSSNYTITFPDPLDGKLYAEVTDKDGEKNNVSFNITVNETAGPIHTYTAILMGGQANVNIGSFYSTGENLVYLVNEAQNNQEEIDLVFFYGTTNQNTIGAPDDSQVAIAHEDNGIQNWTTKNSTRFSENPISGVTFDDITNDSEIVSNATNLSASLANLLTVGEIYAFETASTSTNPGKKGLFHVTNISGTSGADRSITIEVKIQQ